VALVSYYRDGKLIGRHEARPTKPSLFGSFGARRLMHAADFVTVDDVVVKDRNGPPGRVLGTLPLKDKRAVG